ncbi:MAG: PfkB family carbohydrate kinase [Candidatus Lokiarchaeia archaeon]|nr:PfkB family carbohydrate kinase [Candidatus Lokiarchaeia archaeon]
MNSQNTNHPSIVFAGHFAIDNIIRFKRLNKPTLGGSVSYCSLALRNYAQDATIGIISHIGKLNFNNSLLDKIKNKKIDLKGIKYSQVKNTNFVLDYFDHARTLTLKSKSPDLNFKDLPVDYLNNPPDIFVLVPLCNEISYDYIIQILTIFPDVYIGIDLQGFIRKIDEDGKVVYVYDEFIISNIKKIINSIGDRLILKGSEEEMSILAEECDDYGKIMLHCNKFENEGIYIMTLGEKGSMLTKRGEKVLNIPAFIPKKVVDETGAGDVYFSIFLYEFIHSDKSWISIEKAALLASAAASFLVEKKGPAGFVSKKAVLKRVRKKKYIK